MIYFLARFGSKTRNMLSAQLKSHKRWLEHQRLTRRL
jgi:hypothetical protein